jgi:regulation of enolase protein 1 (concanavalin A-like superfamily)
MIKRNRAARAIAAALAVAMMAGAGIGQTYWKRTYGGAGSDMAYAIVATSDGNFIIAGETSSFGAGDPNVYLLKISPNGDTIWTRTYGGFHDDHAYAITPTQDGNFIVAGMTSSFGAGGGDVYLLKISPNGDTIWTRTYGGIYNESARAITPTQDGNFIVAGEKYFLGDVYLYLLKISPKGDTVWTRTYGGLGNENAIVAIITPTQDGNFIVAGATSTYTAGNGDVYLLKISPNGDTIWTRTYGGANYDWATAITPTQDGNFIVAGGTSSFGVEFYDVYLLKISSKGETLWTRTYGGISIDKATTIIPTQDGNFIVTGVTFSVGTGSDDIYLLKISPQGDTVWTRTYGGANNYRANAITSTNDGNYIVAGWTSTSGSQDDDDILFLSIISDRYARKDSLFTFKIPVSGDSLHFGYLPIKVPSGMTVSQGGTISWTPKTDSVYMEHAEFLVADDFGRRDTLTFNIFVNSNYHPIKVIEKSSHSATARNDIVVQPISSREVRFSFPDGATSLRIYNISGQLLENISISGNHATWHPRQGAGRYFAKAIWDKRETVRGFTVIR